MAPNDKTSLPPPPEGERIAKVLSRRGIASRREAERLIAAGEVRVNGRVIDSPALNVTARDRITVSGQPLPEEEPARLWLYYKPEGLVTSAADEKGRDTVFDHLPADLPRVMSVGRLDLNSEGLLLLTNDGALKRRLELPSTGWLRKYRVRVNGTPDDAKLAPLRAGITVDGERFQPMQVSLDRVQGANAWLTVGLREGKNREIRRAMSAIGLYVNRLIRTSYGPFRLGELQPGEVEEVRPRVLREQLGETDPQDPPERKAAPRKPAPARKPAAPREAAASRDVPPERAAPRPRRGEGGTALPRPVKPGDGTRALSRAWKEATTPAPAAAGKPAAPKSAPSGGGKPPRSATAKPGSRPAAPKAPQGGRGAAPEGPRKPSSGKPSSGKPSSGKPSSGKPSSGKPSSGKPSSGKPSSGKPSSGKPSSGRPGPKPGPKRPPRTRG